MQFLLKFSQEFNPKVPPEDDVRAGRYSREPKLIFNVFIKYRFGSVPSFAKVRAQKTDFFHNLKVHGCHRNFQIKSHIPSYSTTSLVPLYRAKFMSQSPTKNLYCAHVARKRTFFQFIEVLELKTTSKMLISQNF